MDGMLWVGLGAVGGLGCFGMKMCGASGGGFDFCAKLSHNFLLICIFASFFDQFWPIFLLYMHFLLLFCTFLSTFLSIISPIYAFWG